VTEEKPPPAFAAGEAVKSIRTIGMVTEGDRGQVVSVETKNDVINPFLVLFTTGEQMWMAGNELVEYVEDTDEDYFYEDDYEYGDPWANEWGDDPSPYAGTYSEE
jgi:hypothetical protein